MSDETAFLEALRVNPADDTARLVYADWLDEYNRPREAEYLRTLVEVVGHGPKVDLRSSLAMRLCELEHALPPVWRTVVGNRFDLIICEVRPEQIISTIKAIRELFLLSLSGAKVVAENPPVAVELNTCLTTLTELQRELTADASLALLIQPSGGVNTLVPRLFFPHISPWPSELPRDVRDSFLSAVASVFGVEVAETATRDRVGNKPVLVRSPASLMMLAALARALAPLDAVPLPRLVNAQPAPLARR